MLSTSTPVLPWGWSVYMLPGDARRVDRRRQVRTDSMSYYGLAGEDGVVPPARRRAWNRGEQLGSGQ